VAVVAASQGRAAGFLVAAGALAVGTGVAAYLAAQATSDSLRRHDNDVEPQVVRN
jgi:hypothetical protein